MSKPPKDFNAWFRWYFGSGPAPTERIHRALQRRAAAGRMAQRALDAQVIWEQKRIAAAEAWRQAKCDPLATLDIEGI